jgi:hypothetical protein
MVDPKKVCVWNPPNVTSVRVLLRVHPRVVFAFTT